MGKTKQFSLVGMIHFAAALSAFAGEAAGQPATQPVEQTDLFVGGKGGYHTYRIPALIVTAKGTVLAFCEGRKTSRNDYGDIDLMLRRSTDGGKTWSDQTVVYEEGGTATITIGNPCPVVDEATGAIWLPFCRNNRDVFVSKSTDDGLTWSKPVDITKEVKPAGWDWYATGPGVGIQLRVGPHKGRLIIPCDHGENFDGKPFKSSHVVYSDDHGQSWRLGASLGPHTNECQIIERTDGSLLLNMRNHFGRDGMAEKGGKRALATSRDGGETWSDVRFDDALIEPVCQASLIRYRPADSPGRPIVLFSNPADRKSRVNVTVRLSEDDGQTWRASRSLHAGPSCYSSLAALPDGSIGCLYERGEKQFSEKITFAQFSLEWLTAANATSKPVP
jgi:sialidase-1